MTQIHTISKEDFQNTWKPITLCILFALKTVTLQKIIIPSWKYMIAWNTRKPKRSVEIITIRKEYLKPIVQTNNHYYWTEIVIQNPIIVYNLAVLDRNTWNHKTVYKLFVLGILETL